MTPILTLALFVEWCFGWVEGQTVLIGLVGCAVIIDSPDR